MARGDLNKQVQATGKLDAVRKVDVGAQVSGQLQTLYVQEGDKVKKVICWRSLIHKKHKTT